MAPEILAYRVTKTFKKTVGLKDATVSAGKGISIILGPNGAGKSTLLRCMGGLYHPESGRIRVFGGDPYYDDAIRKRVSLLSDNYALYDKLSVLKNLMFFGRLYGNTDQETLDISKDILKRLNAYQFIDRKAGELSRGTKQKVAICRALLGSPDAFLLDEPTAFLDALSAEEVHIMLEEFAKDGKTIVYATQRLNEATRFKADIFVIKKGRISKKLGYGDLYGKVLKNAKVDIKLADAIDERVARKMPHFKSMKGSELAIIIRSYKDINESAKWLMDHGAYVIKIDYTEPMIEDMLAD
ncbi:MAG: ABC transporter ATP-binding protein [Candidatus Micrarchaeota archaeon]|nr:ABC transporter ATP-binding protein [Candidatus Micrarchaeota archaeon]MDE1834467.1 ABC transporter ATP-binding protein [Candidatus Micrarchaeota archaeon]MDE1859389.1 ABC transporter ATP-binding protein [Candidatus Micrarchaeota archaeon]